MFNRQVLYQRAMFQSYLQAPTRVSGWRGDCGWQRHHIRGTEKERWCLMCLTRRSAWISEAKSAKYHSPNFFYKNWVPPVFVDAKPQSFQCWFAFQPSNIFQQTTPRMQLGGFQIIDLCFLLGGGPRAPGPRPTRRRARWRCTPKPPAGRLYHPSSLRECVRRWWQEPCRSTLMNTVRSEKRTGEITGIPPVGTVGGSCLIM